MTSSTWSRTWEVSKESVARGGSPMKGAIEFTQKTLGGAVKEVPPSQVFDFSFVQKAAR